MYIVIDSNCISDVTGKHLGGTKNEKNPGLQTGYKTCANSFLFSPISVESVFYQGFLYHVFTTLESTMLSSKELHLKC